MMFEVLIKLFSCLVFDDLSPSLIVTIAPYLLNMKFVNLIETSIVEHALKLDSSMTA
jgi:hypothetical protein